MSARKIKALINSCGLLRNRVMVKALDDAEVIFVNTKGA